jgi:hypothetical protein
MADVLVLARLVLAVWFVAAAGRRLLDRRASRAVLAGAGVPAGFAGPGVHGLVLVEVAVASGLVFAATARAAAAVALGYLFAAALHAGVRIARHGAGTADLSAAVRTITLAVPAAALVWSGGGPGLADWVGTLSVGQRVAVAVALLAIVALVRIVAPARRRTPPTHAAGPPPPAEDAWPSAAALVRRAPTLTIGMATYDDFDGVYFTVQALRLYHDLDDTELVVVDNFGCPHTRDFVRDWAGGTYVLATDVVGTAAARDMVFRAAHGSAVLCCDSHVLLAPDVVARLKAYHREHPTGRDLLQGPLVYDDGASVSTHFDPVWRDQMWGIWATDPRGSRPDGEPFEIGMQGLGVFSCRTDVWPGFPAAFRGFGGEEGYLHEKFRRAGGRCLCLPWLRWMHRFGRPRGVPYPLTIEDKLRNYLVGHADLGLDPGPVIDHFSRYLPRDRVIALAAGLAS